MKQAKPSAGPRSGTAPRDIRASRGAGPGPSAADRVVSVYRLRCLYHNTHIHLQLPSASSYDIFVRPLQGHIRNHSRSLNFSRPHDGLQQRAASDHPLDSMSRQHYHNEGTTLATHNSPEAVALPPILRCLDRSFAEVSREFCEHITAATPQAASPQAWRAATCFR